ncbi:MAG: trypsin-like peptidase domain-containing protein [Oscillospiraceae bacterium]|nr:trypsin-like peptidase domain-containing protein [Oscillospiraceae bacterium]
MKESVVKHRPSLKKTLCLLLIAALFFGCGLAGITPAASAEQAAVLTLASDDRSELSAADLYEQNVNATVGITTSGRTTSRYGYGYTYQASGSGFIITSDGYILTNYHVIDGSDTVTVATYDNETFDAKIVGYDESNDIAVLKIDAENLKPVTVGDSDRLRVGDTVYAIGNPLGELTFSLTRGIVSALSRNISTSSGASMNLIQTDCAINSGNSGGALFNEFGEVIGITNAKYSASNMYNEAEIDNIGFAIPINSVTGIVSSIIENGYVLKPYIGIAVSPISEETAGITGIKAGAVVRDVTAGAPADQAGIQVNDVIVKVGDTDITDSNTLVQAISRANPGDVMTFQIYRQGEEIQLDVEIGSRTISVNSEEEEAAAETPAPQEQPQNGQEEFQDWSDFPFEEFFNFFGYNS